MPPPSSTSSVHFLEREFSARYANLARHRRMGAPFDLLYHIARPILRSSYPSACCRKARSPSSSSTSKVAPDIGGRRTVNPEVLTMRCAKASDMATAAALQAPGLERRPVAA